MRYLFKIMAAVALLLPLSVQADEIGGMARILNGDTIQIGSTPIRLYGIDTPELDQMCENEMFEYPCGLVAAGMLRELIAGRELICQVQRLGDSGLTRAICFVEGKDVGEMLVRIGIALADPDEGEAYVEAEQEARDANRALWRGAFVRPWDWRAGERTVKG